MTKPIDYTKEPLGKKFFEGIPDIDPHTGEDIGEVRGEIKVCPRCGLRGLAEPGPEGWRYIHAEGIAQLEGGKISMDWKGCLAPILPGEPQ